MLRFFKDVKTELARVAAETGFTVDDARLRTLTDLAQERLTSKGNWPNILRRIQVQCHDGVVVLPDEFQSAYRIKRESRGSMKITDSWWVLAPQNQVPGNWATVTAQDLGETAVYRHPKGRKIKAFSEDATTITIYADNTTVTITPGSRDSEPTPTASIYHDIQRVESTAGRKPFELVYEDEDGVETYGGRFSGYWESASLRYYRVGAGNIDDEVVEVVARRRPIPITKDTSPMLISNLSALRLMLMAVTKEDAGMIQESQALIFAAEEALNEENQMHHPHEQVPAIEITSGFGDVAQV